jgi:hypothetical protein
MANTSLPDQSDVESAGQLIHDLQANNPGLTHAVLAEIAEVTPNTIARWVSGTLNPDRERFNKLVLLRAQRRVPYAMVVPALVGVWSWAEDCADDKADRLRDAEFFKNRIVATHVAWIDSGPRAPGHYWKFTLTLNVSFDYLVFFAFGADRARIKLHPYRDADANGSTSVRFERDMRVPDGKRSKVIHLDEGDELDLYVSYRG